MCFTLKWTNMQCAAYLMVSSRVLGFKVLMVVIEFKYFFLIKRQSDEYNVWNFRRFLFGVSLDVSAFKVHVSTSNLKFDFGVNKLICSRHSNSNFAHSFDFRCLKNLTKISICRGWFLFGVSYQVNIQFTSWRTVNGQRYGEQKLSWNAYY